jgi:hypothetical protein
MKKLGLFLDKKFLDNKKKIVWDEKSVFFAFERIIKEEFGSHGAKNLKADYLKNKRLFITCESSVWKSELNLNKEEIRKKLNEELGGEEIFEIKIK